MSLQIEVKFVDVPGTPGLHDIRVQDVNGQSKRVGFCPAEDGAACRFVRILSNEQRKEIVAEVAKQRKERGLATDTRSSQPPDPEAIRGAVVKGKVKS